MCTVLHAATNCCCCYVYIYACLIGLSVNRWFLFSSILKCTPEWGLNKAVKKTELRRRSGMIIIQ